MGVRAGCVLLLAAIPAGCDSGRRSLEVTPLALATGEGAGQPSVAYDPREGFVVTWQERDAGHATLRFAVLDRNGREQRRGTVAQGRDWFVNWADFPSLAVLANGDWVAHWLQKTGAATYAYEIRLVRSTDRGLTWLPAVVPHTDATPTEHGFVSMAPLADDRVLVAWLDGRRGAESEGGHAHGAEEAAMTLRSTVVDRAGALAESRELDASVCDCCQTDAAHVAGRTTVIYRDRSESEVRDISAVTRYAAGNWSSPASVHRDGWRIEGCPVNGPAIAFSGDRMLAVWPTLAKAPLEVRYAIQAQEGFGAARVLDAGPGAAGRVDAVAWPDGQFIVTWLGGRPPEAGLWLALLDADGRVLTRQIAAHLPSLLAAGNPRMAADGDRLLLAWVQQDEGQEERIGLALARER
jgi:hypothetical protein